MAMNRHHRGEAGWIPSVLTGLLVILMPVLVVWSQDRAPRAEAGDQANATTRLRTAVQQGRLSVDVHGVSIRAVLAQIGEQAGIRMVFSQPSARKVSVQFANVEMEAGLRRLLQLAALSYMVIYGPSPTGMSVVQEVCVVGEKGEATVQAEERELTPAPLAAVERDLEADDANGDSINHPFRKLLEQVQALAALSPRTARDAAAPLSGPEAMKRLRSIFQSPNSADALRQQREEAEGTPDASR